MRYNKAGTGPGAQRRRLLIVTGLLVLAGVGTGCGSTSGVVEGGPLGPDDLDGWVCIPAKIGHPVTVGAGTLTNSADQDIVIDGVSLFDDDGLVIIQGLAIPNPGYPDREGSLGSGGTAGFPPDTTGFTEDWSQKMPTTGLVIPAHGPSVTWDLVLGLMGTQKSSSATAIEINYHEAGTQFRIRLTFGMVLRPDKGGCEEESKKYDDRKRMTSPP
ncbi:hypothetical protein D1871_06950 [Nakamurella silvestris]|nr:hypothetical protein D1871_06950 [Nakamurella silvestris]